MNLRQTIAKQQEVWIKKCDGLSHRELDCPFCVAADEDGLECADCPVVTVLLPEWAPDWDGEEACNALPSWSQWHFAHTLGERAAAARLVLDDVNKIARHYHYPVREP